MREWWLRAAVRIERATGYPGWSMVGAVGCLVVMGVAMVGLYWDIAWHVDFGRDVETFTLPHLLVVVGQLALVAVAVVTVACATAEAAPVPLRLWGLHIPWSVLLLVAFRLGGSVVFALDDVWHRAYGLDITLWSPTHLMLLTGGALSSVAIWLMLVETGPTARPTRLGRAVHVVAVASILVGISTAQGEFDFGVPLARMLALPVLVSAAAGLVLVMARVALGPGGALKVAATFVALRVAVALVVGVGLDHSVPHLPLYLAPAVAVELVAIRVGTAQRMRLAVWSGVAVATVGLAGEWAWATAVNGHHLALGAWPLAVSLALVAGVAGAVLGVSLARVVPGAAAVGRDLGQGRDPGRPRPPGRSTVVVAGLALAVALAVPLPRQVGDVEAVLRLDPTGDRRGLVVELTPADTADTFDVLSVHGGARVVTPLEAAGPGRFTSSAGIPASGSWKTVVRLHRGAEVMAVPVHLPADPSIEAPAVPAVAERRATFVDANDLLLREVHDGPVAPARIVLAVLAGVLGAWLVLLAGAVRALAGERQDGDLTAEPDPLASATVGLDQSRAQGQRPSRNGCEESNNRTEPGGKRPTRRGSVRITRTDPV